MTAKSSQITEFSLMGLSDLPPELSDDALALEFADLYFEKLRYVAGWGSWLLWDGERWEEDETLAVYDAVREVCRHTSVSFNNEKIAARIASAATIAAVERVARSDRRLAATVDQWDAEAWELNTPGGIVELSSGEIQLARADSYCTKMTAVAPGGPCPRWVSFLDRITGANIELQRFLQRVCGYALTGSTREHSLFFLYGTGANGKSVFLNTICGILGDYSRSAPIETFVASPAERHPTDLAGLRGARLVTAVETEEGRRWAESRIKSLTGGDRISARFMRQDFFDFTPQFKLLVAGNHKPGLRTVDEAMRRRLHLIPFEITIPKIERDSELIEKLRSEWGGILKWMIEGCIEWQEMGLAPPDIVRDATDDYFETEDALGRWIDECCLIGPKYWSASRTLFQDWRNWSERNNEPPGSQKTFTQRLESRAGISYARKGSAGTRGFAGIGLKTDTTDGC